jgi:ribulose bisphosphate carboxylase small subunit
MEDVQILGCDNEGKEYLLEIVVASPNNDINVSILLEGSQERVVNDDVETVLALSVHSQLE